MSCRTLYCLDSVAAPVSVDDAELEQIEITYDTEASTHEDIALLSEEIAAVAIAGAAFCAFTT